jgi:hypothetical protein
MPPFAITPSRAASACCVERGVARRAVVAGRGERDEGLGDILFFHAHRVIIAAMWRALGPTETWRLGSLDLSNVRADDQSGRL